MWFRRRGLGVEPGGQREGQEHWAGLRPRTPPCMPPAGRSPTRHLKLNVPSAWQVPWPGLRVHRAGTGVRHLPSPPPPAPASPQGIGCVTCKSLNPSVPAILITQREWMAVVGGEEERAGPLRAPFPPQECPGQPAAHRSLFSSQRPAQFRNPSIEAQHGLRGVYL